LVRRMHASDVRTLQLVGQAGAVPAHLTRAELRSPDILSADAYKTLARSDRRYSRRELGGDRDTLPVGAPRSTRAAWLLVMRWSSR
jgi:hypothetical protein